MMKYVLVLLALCTQAQAGYYVSVYGNNSFDSAKKTHFVVAGNGSELKTMFQFAAATKAMKLQELYPQDQVIMVSYNQTPGSDKNLLQIQSWGFQLISNRSASLFTPSRLIQEFLKVQQIVSIDFYNHNSGITGSSLEDGGNRISPYNKDLIKIKDRLTSNSYIILHGCNSGYYMAPNWAYNLGIPVAGTFTSTKLEALHSSGQFYAYQEDLMPATGYWTETNSKSFASPVSCKGAGCMRMKPDNSPYTGMWGDYNTGGGLPVFKFFCSNVSEARCLGAMAESVFSFISVKDFTFNSSFEDYKILVKDFLCPISAKSNLRAQCIAALDRAEKTGNNTYNPFQGKLLACDSYRCYADIYCQNDASGNVIAKSCTLQNDNASSTTFVDEYLTYLKAFQYLQKPSGGGFFGLFQ